MEEVIERNKGVVIGVDQHAIMLHPMGRTGYITDTAEQIRGLLEEGGGIAPFEYGCQWDNQLGMVVMFVHEI